MNITRRLFARTAAILPAFATPAEKLASTMSPSSAHSLGASTFLEPNPRAKTVEETKYDVFRVLFRKAVGDRQQACDRRDLFGGSDPDIMGLRSISTQHKASMIAKDFRRFKDQQESLHNRLKRSVGLPADF